MSKKSSMPWYGTLLYLAHCSSRRDRDGSGHSLSAHTRQALATPSQPCDERQTLLLVWMPSDPQLLEQGVQGDQGDQELVSRITWWIPDIAETVETKTRMLCNRYGIWLHLENGSSVIGYIALKTSITAWPIYKHPFFLHLYSFICKQNFTNLIVRLHELIREMGGCPIVNSYFQMGVAVFGFAEHSRINCLSKINTY